MFEVYIVVLSTFPKTTETETILAVQMNETTYRTKNYWIISENVFKAKLHKREVATEITR